MPFTDPFVANPYPYSFAQTLTTANVVYDVTQSLVAGVYTISWSGGGTLTIDFYNGTTYVGTATGTSSITFNLAQSVTYYKMWNTVSGVSVVISLSALALAPITGTVYTYTASTTPGVSGQAYVVLVGGGGGGGDSEGGGGGSGDIVTARINLTGAEVLTVGLGGGITTGASGSDGTATTFAALTAAPGLGGVFAGAGGLGGGTNGAPGGAGGVATGVSGQATPTILSLQPTWTFLPLTGSTGSGGGGCNGPAAAVGGGSGLGTGGSGAHNLVGATAATGFGSGGGGGLTAPATPATVGCPGVCYIVI